MIRAGESARSTSALVNLARVAGRILHSNEEIVSNFATSHINFRRVVSPPSGVARVVSCDGAGAGYSAWGHESDRRGGAGTSHVTARFRQRQASGMASGTDETREGRRR